MYNVKLSQKIKHAGKISGLQEKIFINFFHLHYLKIFQKDIETETIGFNSIQFVYFKILDNRAYLLDSKKSKNGRFTNFRKLSLKKENAVAKIIFESIEKESNLKYENTSKEEKAKYINLGTKILEAREFIFPKKPLFSREQINSTWKKAVEKVEPKK